MVTAISAKGDKGIHKGERVSYPLVKPCKQGARLCFEAFCGKGDKGDTTKKNRHPETQILRGITTPYPPYPLSPFSLFLSLSLYILMFRGGYRRGISKGKGDKNPIYMV